VSQTSVDQRGWSALTIALRYLSSPPSFIQSPVAMPLPRIPTPRHLHWPLPSTRNHRWRKVDVAAKLIAVGMEPSTLDRVRMNTCLTAAQNEVIERADRWRRRRHLVCVRQGLLRCLLSGTSTTLTTTNGDGDSGGSVSWSNDILCPALLTCISDVGVCGHICKFL
jgi:hypothetical protein